MQPYSHLVIAARLESAVHPLDPAGYYWGSVAPDLRFAAGLRREQTHLSPGQILEFASKYPHLRAFVQGYLVHCLADLVNTLPLLNQRALLKPFINRLSPPFISNILEAYHIDRSQVVKPVAVRSNEMLNDLGIDDRHVEIETSTLLPYLNKPTAAANLAFLKSLDNPKTQIYARESERLLKNRLAKSLWFGLADFEKLTRQVVAQIQASESFREICG